MFRNNKDNVSCQDCALGPFSSFLNYSPFTQLLQDIKDLLWLLGETVLAQLLQLSNQKTQEEAGQDKQLIKLNYDSKSMAEAAAYLEIIQFSNSGLTGPSQSENGQ